ncbi:MAG: hypothetical protein IID32_06780 [Planctomycetes bacterium]|nr:hypothetical protein [Planctomycetota bacterium]
MKRPAISSDLIDEAAGMVDLALSNALTKKGPGCFASTHEALGVITEEYIELVEAVRSNDDSKVMAELMDIAGGCIFAMACLLSGEDMDQR